MRTLLLGSAGQVGSELKRSLAPFATVILLKRDEGWELVETRALARAIRQYEPDVIVNAAAYTNVDRADSEPE